MIEIEDKTTLHYQNLVEESLSAVFSVVPAEDLLGIEKIVLLDECLDSEFKLAGGFYRAARNGKSAYIELYPRLIIYGIPFFLPRFKFLKEYSINRMFLHELGHHNYWDKDDPDSKELLADKYMFIYLKKIYGVRNMFFNFFGFFDSRIRKIKRTVLFILSIFKSN